MAEPEPETWWCVFKSELLTSHPVWMAILSVTISTLCFYIYGAHAHWILRKLNVPGPKPLPFYGNLKDFRKHGGIHKAILAYRMKYGKVFSLCKGRSASLVIADPEMVKQILVKEFSKFRNRYRAMKPPDPLSMTNLRDDHWKKVRSMVSPAFTSGKLRQMIPLVEESCDKLVKRLGEVADTGRSVDIQSWISQMTLEVILSAAFGVQSDVQGNPDNEFEAKIKRYMQIPFIQRFLPLVLPFPSFWRGLVCYFRGHPGAYFLGVVKGIIKKRREAGARGRNDLVQLMLTAHEATSGDKLTEDEIMAQSVTFLLAGHETSSNTLSMLAHFLVAHPDVQERLRKEVLTATKTHPDESIYEVINDLDYMDCVVNETLRLNPPLYMGNRECSETCTINGVTIPAGLEVIIPTYTLHRDPDAWPEPDKFDPERFRGPAKESRHPFQFLPFSGGPRNCIGMKFAMMEVKLTLFKILSKYKFVRCPETQIPLRVTAGMTLAPRNGVYVRIESAVQD